MLIRYMRETDWDRVSYIFAQAIDQGNCTMHRGVPEYAVWDASRDEKGRLVAVIDGVVVGWTALTRVSARACYDGVFELAIYVDKDFRRRGVGRALLDALTGETERLGIWTLEAHIFATNTASIALHEACGFRTVGYREKLGYDKNGVWHDVVLMERRSHIVSWEGG
ncbi:MAG: GNAT family N-acetyltransferase [Clostridia bacterium]|nr:GNAT family N-acetyltransferase [Clostridia bacterium]